MRLGIGNVHGCFDHGLLGQAREWRRREEGGGKRCPLFRHCLDVAAVGQALLAADALWRRRLERLAGPDAPAVQTLAVFLFGLHDLGKFATSLQIQ